MRGSVDVAGDIARIAARSRCIETELQKADTLLYKDLERIASHYGLPPALDRRGLIRALALHVSDGDDAFAEAACEAKSRNAASNLKAFVEERGRSESISGLQSLARPAHPGKYCDLSSGAGC